MALQLIIANKAYSSWSLRPWILLTHFQIPFEEIVIALDFPDTREKILEHSPNGKCPALRDGAIEIWESLAILEYIAEQFPDKEIWPADKAARAQARSLASEMHAGFSALRQHCPTQLLRSVRAIKLTPEVEADVARIEKGWARARTSFGAGGPFLFGRFSAADAMFAPVVNRLHTYDIPVSNKTRAYMDAVMELAAWKAWVRGAEAEPWRLQKYDSI
jgi:glutathione S-transferase